MELTADDWHQATRCEGWEVRDVAGHVVGTVQDVVAGTSGSRTPDQEAADLRDLSPSDMAAELRTTLEALRAMAAALDNDDAWASPSGVGDLTIGRGVLTLWFDTFMHADDVRAALGRPNDTGAGLQATLSYLEDELTTCGWGPASVAFTDQDDSVTLSIGDHAPSAPTHKVPAYDFALAVTGRTDPEALGLDSGVNIYAA